MLIRPGIDDDADLIAYKRKMVSDGGANMEKTFLLVLTLLVLAATSCVAQELWWQNAVFYQVYPRSFKDSNGDGVGDIKGITSKLDYFVDLGVTAVWLSPIYKSPMFDFGYDVSDFRDVDPIFGSRADLDELVSEAHSRGLRVVLDFVPNHSSHLHEWFQKAIDPSDPEHERYKAYYIWRGDDPTVLPNNWPAIWSPTVWEWVEQNGQFYLHNFLIQQPDLNYTNPQLLQEMKDVLGFWMDRGVDGFRMDAVPFLVEKDGLPDMAEGEPDPRQNQPGTYETIQSFRAYIDQYSDKVMMTEAWGSFEHVMDYYGNSTNPGAHFTFNFVMIENLNSSSSAEDFVYQIQTWLNLTAERDVWNDWVTGNHDQRRVGSRYTPELVVAFLMVQLMLPGTAVTYYGEEIGMLDNMNMTCDEAHDPQGCQDNVTLGRSRDPQRTPFQWDATQNAGFTSATNPWLPVNSNYLEVNAETELAHPKSHINIYKRLIQLRKLSRTLQLGTTRVTNVGQVLTFIRELPAEQSILVAANLANEPATIDFGRVFGLQDVQLQVYDQGSTSTLPEGTPLGPDGITLNPYAGVVFLSTP